MPHEQECEGQATRLAGRAASADAGAKRAGLERPRDRARPGSDRWSGESGADAGAGGWSRGPAGAPTTVSGAQAHRRAAHPREPPSECRTVLALPPAAHDHAVAELRLVLPEQPP